MRGDDGWYISVWLGGVRGGRWRRPIRAPFLAVDEDGREHVQEAEGTKGEDGGALGADLAVSGTHDDVRQNQINR